MPDGDLKHPTALVPDFDTYPISTPVTGVAFDEKSVTVTWQDGVSARLHVMWLRENAAEDHTCHPVTREQQIQLIEFAADLSVTHAELDASGAVGVSWSDGVSSRFHAGWLRAHGGPDADADVLPARKVWSPLVDVSAIEIDGQKMLTDPAEEARWVEAMHVYGLAILRGIGTDPDLIETVPGRLGPIRTTNFGHIFEVQSRPDADSNAYTAMTLPVHVDLPTREYQPGLQFLHSLKNEAVGGDSLFADGFALAARLKETDPEAYETLTTVPLNHANKAKTTDYRQTMPFLRLGENGEVDEVRWSPWLRAPLKADFDTVDRVYRALRAAFLLAEDPSMQLHVRLGNGDMACFDNRRVLHGRTGFDPSTGERHLRGCYVEREELMSRARILGRQKRAAEA